MDSGKVAGQCETHSRHAICSADTAFFVSARFNRFVQNEVANISSMEIFICGRPLCLSRKLYFIAVERDGSQFRAEFDD